MLAQSTDCHVRVGDAIERHSQTASDGF